MKYKDMWLVLGVKSVELTSEAEHSKTIYSMQSVNTPVPRQRKNNKKETRSVL